MSKNGSVAFWKWANTATLAAVMRADTFDKAQKIAQDAGFFIAPEEFYKASPKQVPVHNPKRPMKGATGQGGAGQGGAGQGGAGQGGAGQGTCRTPGCGRGFYNYNRPIL